MPFTDLPDTQDLILDRLLLCVAEIDSTLPRTKFEPFDYEQLPCAYFSVGGSGGPQPQDLLVSIEEERIYTLTIVIAAAESEYDATDGSTAEAAAVPYIARVKNYFWSHPRLHLASEAPDTRGFRASGTSTGGAGTWALALQRDVWIADSGVLPFQDRLYIEFPISIKTRLAINNLSAFQ